MARMVGPKRRVGPGRRGCKCCSEPPGKKRDAQRRHKKHSEKISWKSDIHRGNY